jgi:hypothetical protein
MDPAAARRARRAAIKADLTEAYTDEEASPPDWVDLLAAVRHDVAQLKDTITAESERFVSEPDIKVALARRERVTATIRKQVAQYNEKVRRLNLIVPHARFTRRALDADEVVRSLYTSRRPNAT